MKTFRIILGGFLFMFGMFKAHGSSLTQMQKLMAEKAFKMPTENNPIVTHECGADPAVLVYNDTVYVYTTNDMQQLEFTKGKVDNGYNKITSLNLYSSKDLVNWTNCGVIPVAGKNGGKGDASWASNSWAPAIAYKKIDGKDKFFLYFADSGNGIGVLSADSPTGPFIDPIKKPLISRQTPTCASVNWLFDPAVMVDEDGKGYIYFGGGHDADKYEHPKTARCAALSDDMISIVGTPEILDPPFLFEDSGINKIGDTYYYSYCTNWIDRKDSNDKDKMPIAVIAYMTSKNPLGPFEYRGYTLENPATYFGASGNNHHWIFNFKNKWYIAYHTQTLEKTIGIEKGGYRNIFINEMVVNEDGSLPIQHVTKEGVKQVGNFAPYETIPAATFGAIRNIAVTDKKTVVAVKDNAYICIKGADLSKGVAKILLNVVPMKKVKKDDNKSVKICIDHFGANGTELGEVLIGKDGLVEGKLNLPVEKNGIHDLYLVLSEGVEIIDWRME